MKKFIKYIKGLILLIKNPYLMNKVLSNDSNFRSEVVKKYNLPQGLPQIEISELFNTFNETVEPYSYLDGGSTTLDIALLKALARKYEVKSYLEIGAWRGESVANISSVVETCYSVNLSKNDILKLTNDEAYANSHHFFSKNISNVKIIDANSLTFDFSSLNKKFDMIFIDGDHHYESVKKDTQTAFSLLNDDNSIIVWHDYASTPEIIRWRITKAILDGSPKEKINSIYHISNTLCAVYLPEKIKTTFLETYKLPNKKFKVTIEMKSV